MRRILVVFSALLIFNCGGSKTSAELEVNWYGEAFELPSELPGANLTEFLEGQDEAELVVSGEIQEVCKMKGCWIMMNTADGQEMRVTFKDYGFFVPKEGIVGKTSILKGVCQKKETSVEMLQHYAQDAGKSEEEIAMITEPKLEYSFEASGVAIAVN